MRPVDLVLVLAAGISAPAQSRLHVPLQHPDLASAVAAARDGDTIELAPGMHAVGGLRIAGSLHIIGPGAHLIGGLQGEPLTLAIPAGKELTLAGLGLSHPFLGTALALEVAQCRGRVTLLDCSGLASIRIADNSQVLLGRCTVLGRPTSAAAGSPGRLALDVSGSTVVLDRCSFTGSGANHETSTSASRAARIVGADVRCVDTTFRGGDAAVRFGVPTLPGAGAVLASASTLRMTGPGSALVAGSFATEPDLAMSSGELHLEPWMSPVVHLGSTATLVREFRPRVDATRVAAGQVATLSLQSLPGTFGALVVGFPGDRFGLHGVVGDAWMDATTLCVPVAGVQSQGIAWTTTVPPAWPLPVQVRWQGVVLDGGAFILTDPGAALLQ